MKKSVAAIALVVFLAVLGVAVYFQWQQPSQVTEERPLVTEPPAESTPSEPRYPIPAPPVVPDAAEALSDDTSGAEADGLEVAPPPEPLPGLDDSDSTVMPAVSRLFGEGLVADLFKVDEFVRRFVVTVDNLPNKKLSRRQALIKPVAGSFQVSGQDNEWAIGADNAQRYAPYVRLATVVDTDRLVAFYVRFYPLFQEAYVELGYPDGYFNDRLVDVIDHLLMTPDVADPIPLVRPHVFYQFADPELEALSAGQKSLLRMGSDNAKRIKAKLAELRPLLVHGAGQGQ